MTELSDNAWVEFSYIDGDTNITLEGAPSLVREIADNLPEELTETATLYVDPEGTGHCHLLRPDMRRNPDGTWQWQD